MGPEDWLKIASTIHTHYYDYDGFVCIHGTDTMAYTASALSFMLVNLGKPVILVGSMLPFGEVRCPRFLLRDARLCRHSLRIAAALPSFPSPVPTPHHWHPHPTTGMQVHSDARRNLSVSVMIAGTCSNCLYAPLLSRQILPPPTHTQRGALPAGLKSAFSSTTASCAATAAQK